MPLNLLLITSDDLNWNAIGCLGSKLNATPHLDSFARSAQVFENVHTVAPICQPSRSAIMTGLVPHRNGALGFDPVKPDVTTLWEILSKQGYFTAGINKLSHMAPVEKFNWDLKISRGPKGDGKPIPNSESFRNPKNYSRDVQTAVEMARKQNKAFFINANIVDPHRPFHGTENDLYMGGTQIEPFNPKDVPIPGFLEDLPDIRKELAEYYTSIRRLDQSIGEIFSVVDQMKLADDTIVAFIADHGMPFPFAKTTLHHDGTKTPFFLRHPDLKKPSMDRTHLASNIDLFPTFLELLNLPVSPNLDARSLVPLMNGDESSARKHVFTHVTSNSKKQFFPGRCVRTHKHSYIWSPWSDGKTRFKNESMQGLTFNALEQAGTEVPSIQQRVNQFLYRAPEEFYDLENDPFERNNLISDSNSQKKIQEMNQILLEHMQKTQDPLLSHFPRS
jgi:N-sulfoglucosamine sulfohydrolase